MDVFGNDLLVKAVKKFSILKKPIVIWKTLVENCTPKHGIDLRKTFPKADTVGDQTVFDLKGNKFRIITDIDYDTQVLEVTHVLTHAEYDKNNWKRDI